MRVNPLLYQRLREKAKTVFRIDKWRVAQVTFRSGDIVPMGRRELPCDEAGHWRLIVASEKSVRRFHDCPHRISQARRDVFRYRPDTGELERDDSHPLKRSADVVFHQYDEDSIDELLTWMAEKRHFKIDANRLLSRQGGFRRLPF